MHNTHAGPRRFLAAAGTALSAVLIGWLIPGSAILFTLPLFLLYFFTGDRFYTLGVTLTIAGTALLFGIRILVNAETEARFDLLYLLLFQLCLTLPLLWLDGRICKRMRLRYRVALMGVSAAALLVPLVYFSGMGGELVEALRLMLDGLLAEVGGLTGIPPSAGQSNELFTFFTTTVINCFGVNFICMYAFFWRISAAFASARVPGLRGRFSLTEYYNERWTLIPFAAGILCVVAGIITGNAAVSIGGWNLALCAGFFIILQGVGIVLFFVQIISRGATLSRVLWIAALILCGAYFTRFAVLFLITIAVVESWIPIRRRFNTADPTPGHGV